ncbi:TIGR01777 family oxidoreductase [Maioricimonas rarisocia]|nr:TIGR01777 family oxidoreductase [Maioricimonas rarisocia]
MTNELFVRRSEMPASAETVFAWHERPGAFERLAPPWDRVELVEQSGGIQDGARVVLRVGPLRQKWIAEHRNYVPGRSFQDVQVSGPFAHWAHTHSVEPIDETRCILEDRIEYRLPAGKVGNTAGGGMVRSMLDRMFTYRHEITADDVAAIQQRKEQTMSTIGVTGASGMVGSTVVPMLTTAGHSAFRFVRRPAKSEDERQWTPSEPQLDPKQFEGLDAVIHLAGENIGDSRWTQSKKQRIRDSRVDGTRRLAEALAKLEQPPKTLVCASATGFYGDRGDEILTEQSDAGTGFLTDVCQEWEAAAGPAREAGIRVVHVRLGMILSPKGGALQKMLTPFKLGGGGVVGDGNQYWSWIALDDAAAIFTRAATDAGLEGPVNAVTPNPVTNREFTQTLAKVLHRPAIIPVPKFAARLALGEMADELLFASVRVMPEKLQASDYAFRYPELEEALRHLLGR